MNTKSAENNQNSLAAQCNSSANTSNDSENPQISSHTTTDTNEIAIEKPEQLRNAFTLELPVLLLFIAWNLTGTVFQNQILFQSCTSFMQYNTSLCAMLANDEITVDLKIIEEKMQLFAAKILMCQTIMESIIPAFISLLIGPWSDKYGRKPILLGIYFGYFLAFVILTVIAVMSSLWQISPWFYLLASIPVACFGGTCALYSGVFCYISDVSSKSDRAFRMAKIEAACFVGMVTASLSSGRLYEATSASFVFACAGISTLIALIYLYIFVDESVRNVSTESGWTKFKAFLQVSHIVDMFDTCFKRRENYDRAIIWLITAALTTILFIIRGNETVIYLFMRDKFNWMLTDYNLFSASSVIAQVFGNIFGTYCLNKILGVPELIIAIIGHCSAVTKYIIVGLAAYSWQIYVAASIGMLKGISVPMCRSFLANIVPNSEIGKIFSITTAMESLSSIFSAPIYTLIYSYTIDSDPGLFNFFSAFAYSFCAVITLMVYVLHKRRQQDVSYVPIID